MGYILRLSEVNYYEGPNLNYSGEFISRSRAIGLREFGPLNIIYHNGRKYRVCQLVVQDAETALTEAKISKKSGYFMTGEQIKDSVCPFSGLELGDNLRLKLWSSGCRLIAVPGLTVSPRRNLAEKLWMHFSIVSVFSSHRPTIWVTTILYPSAGWRIIYGCTD